MTKREVDGNLKIRINDITNKSFKINHVMRITKDTEETESNKKRMELVKFARIKYQGSVSTQNPPKYRRQLSGRP